MMNIQPTKEHLEIIKEIGSKWIVGLATMNGALLVSVLANYRQNLNIWLSISILCFCAGAMSALLVGRNILDMFLKYYTEDNEKMENQCGGLKRGKSDTKNSPIEDEKIKDIQEYNYTMEVLQWTSIICLLAGGLALLEGINPADATIRFNFLVIGLCIMGLFLLGYYIMGLKERSKIYIVVFLIDLIFLLIVAYLLFVRVMAIIK